MMCVQMAVQGIHSVLYIRANCSLFADMIHEESQVTAYPIQSDASAS